MARSTNLFVSLRELAQDALSRGYAVPSFCAWNAEVMETVLKVATGLRSPVILMSGPGEFGLLDPEAHAFIAAGLTRRHRIPVVLHLDHGDSLELVRRCIRCGYSSVMLDYSRRSLRENTAATKAAARIGHRHGVTVEGELGSVGRADETSIEGISASVFTHPAEAAEYVRATGLDLLAPSFGNAHGFYQGPPQLDFRLLERIQKETAVPLVLHGGTGIPAEDIRCAVKLGVVKINVASDLVATVRETLRGLWSESRNVWVPSALTIAMKKLEAVLEKWIRVCGSADKA